MNLQYFSPDEIEARSFAILTAELGDKLLDKKNAPVIKRVIHTTADFDYADNLYFSPNAVELALQALRSGADIVCDTNMAKAGINKAALGTFGGEVHCFMADPDVAEEAKSRGVTRASVCMEHACRFSKPLVFAIGNAPTALFRLHELWQTGAITPAFVIAAPVGFVNVTESKELFVNAKIPAIVARGRKGGSNVAAAITNALLYEIVPR